MTFSAILLDSLMARVYYQMVYFILLVFLWPFFSEPEAFKNRSIRKMPEFTHSNKSVWINSEPLKISSLKGNVVLLDVWTFDCWNCYRSFGWLRSVEKKFEKKKFRVIGIHTPEFDHEKIKSNAVQKVKEFDLKHPVMMDNNFSYWRSLKNRYWPTFYLVDKKGYIRHTFVGETHKDTSRSRKIEKAILKLLSE